MTLECFAPTTLLMPHVLCLPLGRTQGSLENKHAVIQWAHGGCRLPVPFPIGIVGSPERVTKKVIQEALTPSKRALCKD
jgi:hypothetical protein